LKEQHTATTAWGTFSDFPPVWTVVFWIIGRREVKRNAQQRRELATDSVSVKRPWPWGDLTVEEANVTATPETK
jgi:hypothetical protein